jgi:hypothetical protein
MASWYSARLLFEEILVDVPDAKVLFEESVVVFRLKKSESLQEKLTALAKEGEHEYEAMAGNMVRWEFREVLEVQEILDTRIREGTEVYFRWWHNPTKRDFKIMRETHEPPWWLPDCDAEGSLEA